MLSFPQRLSGGTSREAILDQGLKTDSNSRLDRGQAFMGMTGEILRSRSIFSLHVHILE